MTITKKWNNTTWKTDIDINEFRGMTIAEAHEYFWKKKKDYEKSFTKNTWHDIPPCMQSFDVRLEGETDDGGHYSISIFFMRTFDCNLDITHKIFEKEHIIETFMRITEEKDFIVTDKIEITEKGFVF